MGQFNENISDINFFSHTISNTIYMYIVYFIAIFTIYSHSVANDLCHWPNANTITRSEPMEIPYDDRK